MSKRLLLTGATGNVGQACREVFADWAITAWSKHGLDDTLGVDLQRWQASAYQLRHVTEPFDLVIMAHGTQQPQRLADITEDNYNNIVGNNLTSCVALTNALVQKQLLAPGSLLIYCSSIQATTPRVGRGLYACAKAGLEAFMRTAALELAPQTRAIALRLGQLTTTMGGIEFTTTERVVLQARALLPWVEPLAIAKLCLNLYEQPSMTGCVLDVDSGQGRNVW